MTAQPEKRLWWWLLPLGFAFGGVAALAGAVDQAVFSGPLAFVAEPDQYSLEAMVSDETRRSALRGAWWLFAIFVPMLFFNILGEELLFRGVLLPKMTGVFGQGAWFANGVMFAFYHLHQPWGIPATIINGSLFAWAAHRFRSTTIAMIVHGAQTIIILILVAAIVLGSIS